MLQRPLWMLLVAASLPAAPSPSSRVRTCHANSSGRCTLLKLLVRLHRSPAPAPCLAPLNSPTRPPPLKGGAFAQLLLTEEPVTRIEEIVPGTIWSFVQDFGLLGANAGLRMTVIRLRDGTLWVHSPISLTTHMAVAIGGAP